MLPHTMVLRARVPLCQQVRTSVEHLSSATSSADVFSPEHVLSRETREKCMQRLLRSNFYRSPPTDKPTKQAAVLIPLCLVNGQVSLLYTLRSSFMNSHRGQVSFPGGMKDDSDPSFDATARRETEEELGVPYEKIEIWGEGNPTAARNGTFVVPVVGYLGSLNVDDLQVNPKEVADVFTITLEALCDERKFRYTQFRNGYVIPVYEGGKHRVWGLTAGITHLFLSSLLPSIYKNKPYLIRPVRSQR